jgi:Radical SAM superfamily/Iron-sulfur cluster-binding domain
MTPEVSVVAKRIVALGVRAPHVTPLPFDPLQASPYLTCFLPGDSSRIVYAIDELAATSPDVTPPDGVAFGVIGLDRRVVWHHDPAALAAVQSAAPAPVARASLVDSFGTEVVSDLVDRGWLQHPDQLCTEYLLTTAQIEVTAHCNWGCGFCPVSLDRKEPATMPMSLFEEIIRKISPHDTIRYVTFHFYNEPTLDRFFNDRVAMLKRYGLRLRLFTNASNLTQDKIEMLESSGVLRQLVVNLPALQQAEFTDLTNTKARDRTLRHLDAAIEADLPTEIVVNGAGKDLTRRIEELRARYGDRGVTVKSTVVSDRAGTLAGSYHQAVRVDGPLRGCAWPVNHAHFSVSGDMFICCNDYHQREKFGNIRSGSVHEIMTSDAAVRVRRRVFGVDDAPSDYLCRSCHDQLLDFPRRQFRPPAAFPLTSPCARRETIHG